MSNGLVKRQSLVPVGEEWQVAKEIALVAMTIPAYASKFKNKEQALATILTGREMGVGPMASLALIDFIEGAPRPRTKFLLGRCYTNLPGFGFEITETTGEVCKAKMRRNADSAWVEGVLTIQDAAKITVGSQGKMLVNGAAWRNYPAHMLRWRVIQGLIDIVAPDMCYGEIASEVAQDFNGEGGIEPTPNRVIEQDEVIDATEFKEVVE